MVARAVAVWAAGLALCCYAQAPTGRPRSPERPSAARVRAALQSVYAATRYDLAEQEPGDQIRAKLRQVWQTICDGWGALFQNRLSQHLWETSPLLWFATVGGLLIALALLFYHIIWTTRGILRRSSRRAAEAAGETEPLEPDLLRDQAAASAERGDYRGAVRLLLLAALQALHRLGALRFRPGRTNWEYARELEARPQLVELFVPLAATVERVWYGGEEAGADDYARCAGLADRALSGSGRT